MTHPLAPIYPPLDGSILFGEFPDFNSKYNPTLPAYIYSDSADSVTRINFLEFGRATHRVAHALDVKPDGAGKVVALIANTDTILYQALAAGMMRAGLIVSL